MGHMQRLFVGTLYASIDSPPGLDSNGRVCYANAFLRTLETQINWRSDQTSIEFVLISADRGCIKIRAAVVLKTLAKIAGSGIAGLVLLNFSEVPKVGEYLGSKVQTNFECHVKGEVWSCKLLKCKTSLASKFYLTTEGDTLESVLRDRFNVNTSEMQPALVRMKKWYSGALSHPDSMQLKPGYFIAYLEAGMCIDAESVRSNVLSP